MIVLPCEATSLWFIINEEHSLSDHGKAAAITITSHLVSAIKMAPWLDLLDQVVTLERNGR